MNPAWISVIVTAVGLLSNALWTTVNLRIENRILKQVAEIKDWADERFVLKPDAAPAPRLTRRHV